jgi:hypothetical protein
LLDGGPGTNASSEGGEVKVVGHVSRCVTDSDHAAVRGV